VIRAARHAATVQSLVQQLSSFTRHTTSHHLKDNECFEYFFWVEIQSRLGQPCPRAYPIQNNFETIKTATVVTNLDFAPGHLLRQCLILYLKRSAVNL